MKIRVMYIGGRMHRRFAVVDSLGGFPDPRSVEHAVPNSPWEEEARADKVISGMMCDSENYEVESYWCKKVVLRGCTGGRVAFVYVLAGLDEKLLNEAYLKEPGVAEQLKQIANWDASI